MRSGSSRASTPRPGAVPQPRDGQRPPATGRVPGVTGKSPPATSRMTAAPGTSSWPNQVRAPVPRPRRRARARGSRRQRRPRRQRVLEPATAQATQRTARAGGDGAGVERRGRLARRMVAKVGHDGVVGQGSGAVGAELGLAGGVHHCRPSVSRVRNRARAFAFWDLTVPTETSSSFAVSASVRSSRCRSTTTRR